MLSHTIMARARALAGVALSVALLSGSAALGANYASLGTPIVKDMSASSAIGPMESADFNGDGIPDFVMTVGSSYAFLPAQTDHDATTAVQVFLSSPNGLIDATEAGTVFAGAAPRLQSSNGPHIADFNGDGKPDILLPGLGLDTPTGTGAIQRLLLSGSDGLLHDTPGATASIGLIKVHDVCVGDVNGDGAPDVVMMAQPSTYAPAQSVLALNDGQGNLIKSTGKLPSFLHAFVGTVTVNGAQVLEFYNYTSCGLADLNGDGALDLILGADSVTRNSIIVFNDGHGDFSKATPISLPTGYYGTLFTPSDTPKGTSNLQVIPVDVDGDGRTDLILNATYRNDAAGIYYKGGALQLLMNKGNSVFADETATRLSGAIVASSTQNFINQASVGRFSKSGKPDLILNITGSINYAVILKNDGQGHFAPATDITGLPSQSYLVALADASGVANDLGTYSQKVYGNIGGTIGLFNATITRYSITAPQAGAIYSSTQAGSQSFLRFYNTGTSAGTATVTLRNYTTGQKLGTWTSPSIPAGAEQQYAIATVEAGAGTFAKPSYYSIAVQSSMSGYFQHVLWRSTDGTLTNLSTCATGVTADPAKLSGVHTSLLGSAYPSSVVVNNTAAAAAAVTLGVYDARDGTRVGTMTTSAIPAGGQAILTVAAIEAGIGRAPTSGMYHYVIKAEGTFTGYLQHLVTNTQAGVITDMTTECALGVPTAVTSPSPLRIGAVFSSAQSASQSFLRFYNTGQTAGTATVTLRDYATGQQLGAWTSPAIAGLSEQQFAISTVEGGAAFTKPAYYSLSVQSTMPGYFQHVLWRSTDGTLTNLSTCAAGVTADPAQLSGMHSSLLAAQYPSSVVVNNTGSSAAAVALGVYDARDGSRIGAYTTTSIPSNGQVILSAAAIEAGLNRTPTAGMYHYVIKAEGSFTGFLQHLVTNQQAGVVTDMTTACLLP